MSEETRRIEPLGEEGETCRECGAPLAVDQRYCLNCGRRRGGPRVDFRRHLDGEGAASANGAAPPPAPAAAQTPPPQRPQRDYAPLAAVGGIAVLGLMLMVGVLIGKGDGDSTTASQPVQVVSPSTAGEATTAADDEGGERDGKASTQAKAKGSGKKKSADNGGGGGQPVEASDRALQELQEQSPEEYQESSAKLPDEIATGGAPPPEDNKAPGGGSKGTAIE